ncbi:PAN2-PAN3 deadenylation complex catalytic subunit PAN2-like [Ptychodera flava]|uniref:PAN2-PAN3 deadenylation complex catalytic subunit PAN2-like n=1 Tax=Ptychodera flava TaxID=63121 RepID=UPI00396A72C4
MEFTSEQFPEFGGEEYHPEGEGVEVPSPDGYMPGQMELPVGEEFPEEHPAGLDLNGGVPVTPGASYHEMHTVLADGGDRFGVTAVAFDLHEELLWMGNQGGHITSYLGLNMQKYTSFQVHASDEIHQITTCEAGVLALTSDNLRCCTRQGIRLYDHRGENIHDMQCMLQTSPSTLLLGGHHDKLIEFDLAAVQEANEYAIEDPGVAILRQSNYNRLICCGDTSGKITLRDPDTLKSEHVLEAHAGTLSDFDVHGNHLVTCGFSHRLGNLAIDRFLKVYDMRTMRALPPLQLPIEPLFLRYVPTYTSRLAVVTQHGQFQLLDPCGLVTPGNMLLDQVNILGEIILAFDVSSTCQALAFGEAGGYVHLWTDREDAHYNAFSNETELADPVEHLRPIHIDDELTPLSTIPMPFCDGPLLSDWPESNCFAVHRRPPQIDPEIIRSMNMVQFIGYAPNPGNKRRNQVAYREVSSSGKGKSGKTVPQSPIGRDVDPFMCIVPKKYRKVEIKYSKLGVDDFDFKHYNKTNFAGLETHIPNAYCNSMLQVLYFIEPLRCALESHLCSKEFCLACELGFLFHMLDLSKGNNCQGTNFLRAFRTIPEASALGLILGDAEESTGKANFRRLIQNWNRFVLQQIEQDTLEQDESALALPATMQSFSSSTSVVTRLFQTNAENISQCKCGKENTRNGATLLFNFTYPDCSPPGPGKPPKQFSFATVAKNSMSLEQTMQAWCDNCKKYQPTVQVKSLKCLPDVLVINCQIETAKDLEFWKIQQELIGVVEEKEGASDKISKPCRYGRACTRKGCKFNHEIMDSPERLAFELSEMENGNRKSWVPLGLKMKLSSDRTLEVQDVFEEKDAFDSDDFKLYNLHASVAHIQDLKTGGNLVSHIQVGPTYHKRKEGVTHSNWYLYNDFAILPIEPHEAVQFNLEYKIPCILYFIRRDLTDDYDCSITSPIEASVLLAEASLAKGAMKQHITFTPLQANELPEQGDCVGLDAEFVTLNQEEAEIRSDGTRSTIKPSQMTAARITCVRGYGDLEGVPFIDDYISTQEQVVDYLTQFSGIKPGDLDATISSKHLTTLKSTYLKLRYLIDQGVIFVGHGLKKDFRVINVLVPKDQVIDTAFLFSLPKQRIPSLRFLAWFFLGINIQGSTHDSIEDARTALQLYKKYKDISNEGKERENWEATLKNLYEKGRKYGWKVPDDE